jgi:tellurite resistance protein TehA-like permease
MSITCSAWIVSPVTGDASSGIGKKVTHIVFALSTLGFAITITALWQRREALMRLGHHTSWAALTFPFANTAIAAGLYVHALKARHNVALQVWMFVLTVLASVIIAGVTLMYLANGLFLSVETKEHQNTDVVDMPEGDSTSHGEPSSDTSNVGSNTGSTSAPCGVIEILPLP